MVGFNNVIVFNNTGKVSDYQKSYNDNYAKTLKVYLPAYFNNKKLYDAVLSTAINNTFPKQIETVVGIKSEYDLNCYEFDLSDLYAKYKQHNKIGLTRFTLYCDNGRQKFQSESFRI